MPRYQEIIDHIFTSCFLLIITCFPAHVFASDTDTLVAYQAFQKAKVFGDAAQYDSSIYYYKSAALRYEAAKYWKGQVLSLNGIGACYALTGRFEKADSCLQIALDIGLIKLGEVPAVADTYQNLGFNWGKQGDFEERIQNYEMALQIRLATLRRDHPKLAESYSNLSVPYLEKWDYFNALKYALLGLEISEKSTTNDITLSQAFNNVAAIYLKKGQFVKAREYFQEALEILGEQSPGERGLFVAITYSNLGACHLAERQYNHAITSYRRALEKVMSIVGENHIYTAIYYNNLAEALLLNEEFEEAVTSYGRASDIFDKLSMQTHPYYAVTLINLGKCYYKLNDREKFIDFVNRGIAIQQNVYGALHPELAKSHFLLGEHYRELGNWEQSLAYFQMALEFLSPEFKKPEGFSTKVFDEINSKLDLLTILGAKAETLYGKYLEYPEIKTLKQSNNTFLLAVSIIEQQMRELKREVTKQEWMERASPVFEGAIKTAHLLFLKTDSTDYLYQAFSYAESSKATILLEALKDGDARQFSGVPDSLLQEEHDLKVNLSFYKTQWLLAKQQGDTARENRFRKMLFDFNVRFDALGGLMESKYGKYYNLKYDRYTTSVLEAQENLLNPESVLLEYFDGDSVLYIFTVTNDKFNLHTLNKTTEFESLITTFRKTLTNYGYFQDSTNVANHEYLRSAFRLYQLLLEEPLAGVERPIENIIIVPGGKLAYLSFGALLENLPATPENFRYKDLAYVLRNYNISYAYSASFLSRARNHSKIRTLPELAFGGFAPEYNQPNLTGTTDVIGSLRSQQGVSPLPGASKEVEDLSSMFGEKAWIGDSATEKNFKEAASNYQILHLAMHGLLDDQEPLLSHLLFTANQDSLEDGSLRVSEIYNLNLKADLTVLSACNSGLGELKRGEGLLSLSRAFAYAGCPSLLTSLWTVSDETTASIMKVFYENLRKDIPKDQSMRNAQLQYLEEKADPLYEHPYFWAGFINVGNVEPLVIQDRRLPWVKRIAIFSGVIILLIVFVKRRNRKTV